MGYSINELNYEQKEEKSIHTENFLGRTMTHCYCSWMKLDLSITGSSDNGHYSVLIVMFLNDRLCSIWIIIQTMKLLK